MGWHFFRSKKTRKSNRIVEITEDVPFLDAHQYRQHLRKGPIWYWEETDELIANHSPQDVLGKTSFVRYNANVSDALEKAYSRDPLSMIFLDSNGCVVEGGSESRYQWIVDVLTMQQTNRLTRCARRIKRMKKTETSIPKLPPLPDELLDDHRVAVLPCWKGQIIQITHQSGDFVYGSIIHYPRKQNSIHSNHSDNDLPLAPDSTAPGIFRSGWFPKCVSKPAGKRALADALSRKACEEAKIPSTWSVDYSGNHFRGLVPIDADTDEYRLISDYFTSSCKDTSIFVTKVYRIQNLELWQCYQAKLRAMATRDRYHYNHPVNNTSSNIERRWLFHGTKPSSVSKIVAQGFNRSYQVNNVYGNGVYFARDASCSLGYSASDNDGIRYMFLCRVAVGDWCHGNRNQIIPGTSSRSPTGLFDSTVDFIANPRIFATYHDAQSYPEYLVSFERSEL